MTKQNTELWAVAGPIASGKSTLIKELANAGALIIDADKLGHQVLEQANIKQIINTEFGPEFTDRKRLSELVFSDPAKLNKLNQFVRPELERLIIKSINKVSSLSPVPSLAVLDAAIYFQFTTLPKMDFTISVTAPEELRIDRLISRNSFSRDQAIKRVYAQRDLYAGFLSAEVVMVNSGTEEQFLTEIYKFVAEKIQR
jgi:dephospho-CoA kinase